MAIKLGPIQEAAETAWDALKALPKVRKELKRRGQKGCVIRVIDYRMNSILCVPIGYKRKHVPFRDYDASFSVAARMFRLPPERRLSFNESMLVPEESSCAALRLGVDYNGYIVSCGGIWSELAAIMLLRIAIETAYLTKEEARALTLEFPTSGDVSGVEWIDL